MLEPNRGSGGDEKESAMSELRIQFGFNTAITGLPEETGAWDEKAHNTAVLPLRGLIMQIDGVTGCHIARYAMSVQYIAELIDRGSLTARVKAAVEAVANREELFPLRGDKKPAATVEVLDKTPSPTWWVARVDFDTDLFVDDGTEGTTSAARSELRSRLANADGARNPGVGQRALYVQFDKRIATRTSMENHLRSVVAEVLKSREEKKYFPFGEPSFTYRTYETPYVI